MTEDDRDLIAGRYRLVERIGQGGMGRVWRGTDRQLFDREVAIKEIIFPPGLDDEERATLLRRFTGEARAAVSLHHPGIITIHDVVEHEGSPVIVMEFVRGQSLAAAIREQGRLPVRRVAEIGAVLLGALAEAHAAGIVHRDIKPDNVLLTRDRVVLTDFGIAYLSNATTKLSHSGLILGTPQYMPPEQLEGKRPTPANDLWALGATLYHAVEGRPPFDAEGLHALAIAVFVRPHRPPTQAGPLAPLLEALLAKDPAERAGVAEAIELISVALRESDTRPAGAVTAVPPPPERSGDAVADSGELAPEDDPAPHDQPAPHDRPVDATPAPVTTPAPPTEPPSGTPQPYAGAPAAPATPAVPATAAPPVTWTGTALHSTPTPWAVDPHMYRPVTNLPPEPPAREPGRFSAARRATVLGVALATLAAGGVLAWALNLDKGKDDDRTTGTGSTLTGGPTTSGSPGGATGTAGNGSGSGDSAGRVTVVIGVDAPLTGSLASLGIGIRNSADLAVKTANRTGHVPGVTFELRPLDDQAQPARGQQNATQLVADPKVLGVVGPLNSSVAQSMLSVYEQAGLVDVSPANTNPVLSQGEKWAAGTRTRPYKTYFRTVTTDAVQGPFAAQYLYKDARKRKVFVVDDRKTYGSGLASGFAAEFARLGGTVVGTEHINTGDRDFAALVQKVRSAGAEAVYFGGEYPEGGPLSQQLRAAGTNVPLVGGDGLYSDDYLGLSGKAEGDLATSVGVDPAETADGRAFLEAYRAGGYPDPAGSYGASSYDAAWSVIEAVKAVVEANGGKLPTGARSKVVQAMGIVDFSGYTGRVAFDEYGDILNRRLSVYSVTGGAWKPAKSGAYTP
ncbi:ABC transporter substrate-binding protein [Kitasatospora sp. NPDC004240]